MLFLCTQIYKYRDLTGRDLNVTSHYKDLKPVLDNYGKTYCGSKLQTHLQMFKCRFYILKHLTFIFNKDNMNIKSSQGFKFGSMTLFILLFSFLFICIPIDISSICTINIFPWPALIQHLFFYFSVQWWLYQRAAESHRNGASKLPRYGYTAFKGEDSPLFRLP